MNATASVEDLFGVGSPPNESEEGTGDALGSLPDRVLNFFKDHKYETFNMLELFTHFKDRHPTLVRRTARKLWKERKLACTGESRGPGPVGLDHVTLTLNLYKSDK